MSVKESMLEIHIKKVSMLEIHVKKVSMLEIYIKKVSMLEIYKKRCRCSRSITRSCGTCSIPTARRGPASSSRKTRLYPWGITANILGTNNNQYAMINEIS